MKMETLFAKNAIFQNGNNKHYFHNKQILKERFKMNKLEKWLESNPDFGIKETLEIMGLKSLDEITEENGEEFNRIRIELENEQMKKEEKK